MSLLPTMWRDLTRRPRRTALTTFGVCLASCAYLVIVGLANGLSREFEEVVSSLGTEVVVQQAGMAVATYSHIDGADLEALGRVPHVTIVSPVAVAPMRLPDNAYFLVFGAEPDKPPLAGVRIVEGRMLEVGQSEIMVGRAAASALDLASGDAVELLRRHVVTVAGVYETGRGLLDAAAILDLAQAQTLFRLGSQANLAFLKVDDAASVTTVIDTIETSLPDLDASPSDLWVSSHRQLEVVARFARAFALIAVVLAALGVANSMSMNVMERTTEIAILRSVGWSRRRLGALVLGEALLMAATGILLAIPLSRGVLTLLDQRSGVWFASSATGAASLLEGTTLVLAGAAIGTVPALLRVLRLRPARALRSRE